MIAERWPVPAGWAWSAGNAVGQIVGGGTPKSAVAANFSAAGIPWLTPADLTGYNRSTIGRGRRDLSETGLASSGATLMPRGTVLLSSRAPIGYCAIAENPISTNQGFKSVIPADGIEPAFLRHYFLGSIEFLNSLASGTTFLELSGSRVGAVPIPVAPTAEQRRIVAKIDRLSARSKRARDELERGERLVARYKRAVLEAAYAENLDQGSAPPIAALSDFVLSLDQGWSPKCEAHPAEAGGWSVMKTTAVQPFCFYADENKALPRKIVPREELVIRRGDIIVTRAGPRNRVGIACVSNRDHPGLMLCDKAYRLRVKVRVADPTYVCLMLNSPQCLQAIESIKTGGNDSGLNLTQAKFLAIELPAIPVAEQTATVRRIEHAFAAIDRLAAEEQTARALLDKLDQVILAKAFRGELVPQDPNDEPASVLLERIRAERAAAPGMPRGRK